MGILRRSSRALAVCLTAFALAAPALAGRPASDTNSVRARSAAPAASKDGREPASLGLPPGSQQLSLDDGSSEFSVGVTDDAGHVGSQGVFLNCFTPPASSLPLTIDTVSILFPTSDQFGSTGLFPGQSYEALVYVDPDSTGDPRDADLVARVPFDLEPSNTLFQNVTLDDPVTVSVGTVYVGFTDPYVAVTHEAIYPVAVDTDSTARASYAFHNLSPGDDFDGEHLADAENGGFVFPDGSFMIRAFYTTGGSVRLCWDPAAGDGAPPTNNRVCTPPPGSKCGECAAPAVVRDAPSAYNVYRGTAPNVQPTPGNLFTTVPATQTSASSGVAPGGSFFVITAVYPTSGESAASNEVGVKPATVTSVKVKPTKIVAKGTDFTPAVQVFVDGIPFASAATVKGGKKVTQKGNLVTGQSVRQYIDSHGGSARITFRNASGATATATAH
jgi:hypothetical protein